MQKLKKQKRSSLSKSFPKRTMFFKMQNMFVGERLRIFRVKKTFFQNQELSVFHQIWLVFGHWHFDFWWVRDGISAEHSDTWLLSGYIKSGWFQWKKNFIFLKIWKNLELLCNLGSKCLVGNCDCWGKSKGWKKVEQHHVTFGSDIHKKIDQKSRFVW